MRRDKGHPLSRPIAAPALQPEAKIGLLAGSLPAGLIGFAMLALAAPRSAAPPA